MDQKFQFVQREADDPHVYLIWLASFLGDVHHPAGSFEARFLDHVHEVLKALFIVFEVHLSRWR